MLGFLGSCDFLRNYGLLNNYSGATSAHRLHGNRYSQRIAAEKRQPDGYRYRNKFFDGTSHVRSLAKLGSPVKC